MKGFIEVTKRLRMLRGEQNELLEVLFHDGLHKGTENVSYIVRTANYPQLIKFSKNEIAILDVFLKILSFSLSIMYILTGAMAFNTLLDVLLFPQHINYGLVIGMSLLGIIGLVILHVLSGSIQSTQDEIMAQLAKLTLVWERHLKADKVNSLKPFEEYYLNHITIEPIDIVGMREKDYKMIIRDLVKEESYSKSCHATLQVAVQPFSNVCCPIELYRLKTTTNDEGRIIAFLPRVVQVDEMKKCRLFKVEALPKELQGLFNPVEKEHIMVGTYDLTEREFEMEYNYNFERVEKID